MTPKSSIRAAHIARLALVALLLAPAALASPASAAGRRGSHAQGVHRCEIATRYRHLGRRCGIVRPRAPLAAVGARGHLRASWRFPGMSRTVSGDLVNHHCQAGVAGASVAHVDFSVDGHRLNREYFAPYTCFLPTHRLAEGAHRLTVVAADFHGHRLSRAIVVHVDNAGTSSSTGSTWSDSFASGDFSGWSWWGQGDPTYAHRSVIDPTTEGVPRLGSAHVARFETTPADVAAGHPHAKIFKSFGTELGTPQSRPPTDVSGTYSAWYYLPATYKVSPRTWVNVFQFKEKYRVPGADDTSDPLWWVQFTDAGWAQRTAAAWQENLPGASRPDAPVAMLNRQGNDWKEKRRFLSVPLARWFEITAVVHQGDRIDFFLDGQSLDTAHASEYPVSPFHGAAGTEWMWGVGNYSTAANGPLYLDNASFTHY